MGSSSACVHAVPGFTCTCTCTAKARRPLLANITNMYP